MTLIVYGARCSWWDSIDKVAKTPEPYSIPCCPFCRSVLFQQEETSWHVDVKAFDMKHPGYREFINWLRGKCYRYIEDAVRDYTKHTGKSILDYTGKEKGEA